MPLNQEEARIVAHRVLIDAEVFNDSKFGAKDCKQCQTAALNQAGQLARGLALADEKTKILGTPPRISEVNWGVDVEIIKAAWSETVRIAHARHR